MRWNPGFHWIFGNWPAKSPSAVSLRRALFLTLLLTADVLFWREALGVSVVVFLILLFAAALVLAPSRRAGQALAILLVGCLPVIDHMQVLSFLIAITALILSLIWLHPPEAPNWDKLLAQALRLMPRLPFDGIRALRMGLGDLKPAPPGSLSKNLREWAFPIGGTLVLISLLVEANPILENWVLALPEIELLDWETVMRALFWFGLGLMIWPLTAPIKERFLPSKGRGRIHPNTLGINDGSIGKALILFNLMLAVQTVTDGVVLWGEWALPDGMTYAEYARRGSYPLLATAVLAGAFSLATRPFLAENPWLKPLLMLWLLQNVILSGSAAYRLGLYVEAYGLTYLRVYVMIWISLVAIGLVLVAVQISRQCSNRWLLLRCVVAGGAALYCAAFVNVAALIATYNFAYTQRLDHLYLCALPDTAEAALREASKHNQRHLTCCRFFDHIDGWRDWGFRRWHVSQKLTKIEGHEAYYENSCR
ncbi:MAG: DUF4173 domain-containing protein [Pseudomonadota bacterium]